MLSKIAAKFNEHNTLIGIGAIIFATFLWSIDALFLRTELYNIPAEIVVFWEHFFGFILLSPFLIKGFHKIKYLTKKDWFAILWISIVGSLIGTMFITKSFFGAFELGISISIIVILQKLQPLSALLLARVVLKERLTKIFYFWASIAIMAAFFLAFGIEGLKLSLDEFFNNPVFYAIIAALAFGSSTVFGKHLINHIDFKTTTSLRFGFASIFAFIYIIIFSSHGDILNITPTEWKYIGIIVISTGAVALFIYYFGIKKSLPLWQHLQNYFFHYLQYF